MQTFPVIALLRKVTLEEVIYTPRKIAEVEAFNARGALAKVKKDYIRTNALKAFYAQSICIGSAEG